MKTVEESMKALSRSVLDQARSEAKEIIANAQINADAKRKSAQEQAATERSEALQRALRNAQDIRSQAIAAAKFEAQKLLLERREKLLEEVFNTAQQNLVTLPERKDYDQIIRHLIKEAIKILNADTVRIRADSYSQNYLTKKALDEIQKETNVQIHIGAALDHGTGVIVETMDEHRRYDNTLEARLSRLKSALRSSVYHLLMGEPQ
jgi:vacuolar-type H+-ATPase subunit E/Vma4